MKMCKQKTVMKCVGGALAVCSAAMIACSAKGSSTKKTLKKTVNKMADIVDSITAFM